MLLTKIQPKSFLGSGELDAIYQDSAPKLFGSGEEELYVFLPYMGMAAILSMTKNNLNKYAIPFRQKASCEIL